MSARLIGRPTRRIDGPEKLTATTRFAGDLTLPGMLYARLVLSPYAHARIERVESAAARQLPGCVAVLTAADLPIQRVDDLRKSDPLARDRAVWAGQPVAIVVAETEAVAEDAASLVEVSYAAEPPVLGLSAAMLTGARVVRDRIDKGTSAEAAHATAGAGEAWTDDRELSANVSNQIRHRRGDIAAGFAEAEVVVERRCRTSAVHQSYLEPQTALASVDGLGSLTVWASTQSVFYTRQELAASLGLPVRRVRIVAAPLGGGFGGKVLVVEPLVAAAALALRRPVRLTFTRTEDFLAGNPANAGEVWVKLGARRDGTLTALAGEVIMDAGAFPEWSPAGLACFALGSFYRCPNLDIRGYDVMTHGPAPAPIAPPVAPQGAFAIETAMDDLARRLGLDPLTLRVLNGVREGDPQPDGTPWPRIGLMECLERLRSQPVPMGSPTPQPPPPGGRDSKVISGGDLASRNGPADATSQSRLAAITDSPEVGGPRTADDAQTPTPARLAAMTDSPPPGGGGRGVGEPAADATSAAAGGADIARLAAITDSPPPGGGGRGVGVPPARPEPGVGPTREAIGTGIAIGGWPGALEPAAALCRLDQDGSLRIVTGSVDMTGTNTTLALIAAEAFGTTLDQVSVVNEDSSSAPYAGISGGSKITYTVGRAVQRAAEDARRQVRAIAATLLEVDIEDVEIQDGRAQVLGAPHRGISLPDLAAKVYDFNGRFEPVEGRGASATTVNAPGCVAHRAQVAVDLETGAVELRSYEAIQDVGRALNPAAVEGQVHGGVAQGIGWGLYERIPYDDDGQSLAASFLDYAIPTATRVPSIWTCLVEVPAEEGPFGARAVGEPPVVPVAAAIANAIRDATGVRLTDLPITPERLYQALRP